MLLSKQRTSRRNWFSFLAGSVLATRAHVALAQRKQSADIVILGSGLGNIGCIGSVAKRSTCDHDRTIRLDWRPTNQ